MPRRKPASKYTSQKRRKRTKGTRGTKLVMYSARRRYHAKRRASGLEEAVYKMLREENITFVREKTISQMHVDIFIDRTSQSN